MRALDQSMKDVVYNHNILGQGKLNCIAHFNKATQWFTINGLMNWQKTEETLCEWHADNKCTIVYFRSALTLGNINANYSQTLWACQYW